MTRIRDLAASSLAVLCLLAGCSDGAAPAAAPAAPSGSTSPSASPADESWPPYELLSLEEPRPLEFSRRIKVSDTEAIMRQLVAEMTHALRTTFPPENLRVASGCALCQEVVEMADTANDERIRYELDDWVPRAGEVDVLPGDEYADRYLRLVLRLGRPELRVVDRNDEQVDVVPSRDPVTVLVIGVLDEVNRYQVVVWDELEKLQDQRGT